MAWIIKRKRTGKHAGKPPWLSIGYRDYEGNQKFLNLRTTDRKVAAVERDRIERDVEKRADAPVVATAREAVGRFLGDLERVERLLAPSVQVYRERLEPLVAAYGRVPLSRWNRSMLKDFIALHPEWSPRTVQLTVNACKRLIVWCQEDAHIECPDFVVRNRGLVPTVRVKTDHEVFTLHEVALISKEVFGEPCGNRWIDLAFNLAFWAALPLGDIATIEWKHIDLRAGTLTKRRKKTDELIVVPIAEPLRRALLRHPGIAGRVVAHFPKSASSARKSLVRKIRNAGLAERPKGQKGFHLVRHSAASALDHVGATEATINLILGHSPGSMTRRYTHADLKQARRSMERLDKAFKEARLERILPRLEERQERLQAG
jgi:integrase